MVQRLNAWLYKERIAPSRYDRKDRPKFGVVPARRPGPKMPESVSHLASWSVCRKSSERCAFAPSLYQHHFTFRQPAECSTPTCYRPYMMALIDWRGNTLIVILNI